MKDNGKRMVRKSVEAGIDIKNYFTKMLFQMLINMQIWL